MHWSWLTLPAVLIVLEILSWYLQLSLIDATKWVYGHLHHGLEGKDAVKREKLDDGDELESVTKTEREAVVRVNLDFRMQMAD